MTSEAPPKTPSEDDKPLRLFALDDDDLEILSANLQDALIPVSDIAFLPEQRRFVLAGKRYDWVRAKAGGCQRRAAGLHFECVRAVSRTGFHQGETDRVLNLLAIDYTPTEAPAGHVTLLFSGGAAIRLEVECIEAQMRDLGPRYPCDKQPVHDVEASA